MSGHPARETSAVARLLATDAERGLRVAFYRASPYRNELYRQKNRYGYAMHFFSPRLELDTVPLAASFPVVVFSAKMTIGNIHEYELGKRGSELTNAVVSRGS